MAVDVLELDGGVVDQDPDRQRQATQGHEVDRLPEDRQAHERHEDRQRDRYEDDERAAPAPEKEQDHQRRQACCNPRLFHDADDGRAHKHGLIKQQVNAVLGRQCGQQRGQCTADAASDVERGRSGALEQRHEHAAPAVGAHEAGLRREAVADLGDVADGDRRAVHRLDRQRCEIAHGVGAAIEAHEQLLVAELRRAGGQDEILGLHGVAHLVRRQAERVEPGQVDVDHHLALLASVREGHLGPLHRGEARTQHVARQVVELLLGERVGVDRPLDDGDVRRAVVDDERRGGAGRQELEEGLRDGGHLCVGHLHLRARVEEDLGDRHAIERLALDVLDAVDGRRQPALEEAGETLLHLVRRQATVLPDDGDHRDVDLGQDVGRHPQDRVDPADDDEHRHDDKGVRAPQREADDPHGFALEGG